MTLRVDLRTADTTLSVSGRSARELLETLAAIGHRLNETTLLEWLEDLHQQGLAEQDDAGRWRLSDTAMRAFGHGLSLAESPSGRGDGGQRERSAPVAKARALGFDSCAPRSNALRPGAQEGNR
jgi:uncharacterized protein with von Willebrand factor type A (vWA) domain